MVYYYTIHAASDGACDAIQKEGGGLKMAQRVLVGSTGFVGGNLLAAGGFDAAYHSSDIQTGFDQPNGLVVYAGVPAAMFLANADPEADLALMRTARENLRRLRPRQVVLVSTIAVYADSRQKDESAPMQPQGLPAYGANRLQLEQWVRQDWPDALILRLPALYGRGLKKNFLYDLHTITPALLRPDKYTQLSRQSPLVQNGYSDAGNGFYKLNGQADAAALRGFFAANDFNALSFTDSRSRYQFYPLARLWGDIQTALSAGVRVLNLATPPVSAAEVYRAFTGRAFENRLKTPPYDYDMRTAHAGLLGGQDGYLCTREEELADVCAFLRGWAAAG